MTREEIINTMIDTVNKFNANLMKEGGATDRQIADAVVQQRPSFEGMFNLIYDDLVAVGVFE
jgi:hypothetical protein